MINSKVTSAPTERADLRPSADSDTPLNAQPVLHAADVFKSYQDIELSILNGVSLDVARSETVAIMGRSGCGKSTFISMLAGLDRADRGVIEILGEPINRMPSRELNRFRASRIGIIFQQFHLLEHLTAFENIRLPLDLNRVANSDEVARAMLKKVRLDHRADHFPNQLSRGECQRVAIARVLVMRPAIILADEPTGSLDVRTGHDVMELLFDLVEREKIALVMATHDPRIAEKCSRLLYMSEGTLSASRPADFAIGWSP